MVGEAALDMPRILDAVVCAVRRHHGQLRKTADVPYALHPLRVARAVAGAELPQGADRTEVVLAAILHDTLEDTDWTEQGIREAFGEEAASIVSELTQDKSLPKAERRAKMIEKCGRMSPGAKLVKLADRLDNMREMEKMDRDFIERYCREARAMVEAMRGICPRLEEEILALVEKYGCG